jgi:hypothetical protein
MRRNNADDEVAVRMIEEILSWMKNRAQKLGSDAQLEWSYSSAHRPGVNLRIRGVSQAIPHLEGVPGGGGWISCRDVMRQHPEALRSFLERVRRLNPYKQLAQQLLSGEKNDFKMTRDYLGDPTVRVEVLAAMADMQDAIIRKSR